MRAFVGVTDYDWYQRLSSQPCDEVNFWKPGGSTNFKALEPGELFLFKLHAPLNSIVVGGFFVWFYILPGFLAWEAFGEKKGTQSFEELEARVAAKYRKYNESNSQIGCRKMYQNFY